VNKKALEERIKFLTELLKLLWITFLAMGGGTISLILNMDSAVKVFLAVFGLFTEVILGLTILVLIFQIRSLINRLESINNQSKEET